MTPTQIAMADAYTGAVLIIFLSFIVLFPLMTWIFKSEKSGWGKFLEIYASMIILLGIITWFVYKSPNSIINIVDWIKNLINF